MSALSLVAAQDHFTATLSAVDTASKFAFRRRFRDQEYQEAVAEARAAAWSAWHGLLTRGKDPVEVGVHGIAANAVRYVRNRRKVGNRTCGRGAMDVFHPRAQAACGFRVVSLDSEAEVAAEPSFRGSWVEWLAGDNKVTPADEAAFRVDFASWLGTLPVTKGKVAALLAEGHEGVVVARLLGLSPGRVSQVRSELEASWRAFQAEPACPWGLA